MQKLQQRKRLTQLLLLVLIVSAFSCTKLDTNTSDSNFIQKDFFEAPANTNPLVQRVIDEYKIRNTKSEFVKEFSNTKGFPVWNKVIINIVKDKSDIVSFTNSTTSQDTVIYIPFVKKDSSTVNGYILATLHDSIYLRYCLAQDYKNYPFTTTSTVTTASQFTLQILRLNQLVFGVNDYIITDPRLFSSNLGLRKTKKLSFKGNNGNNFDGSTVSLLDICVTYFIETEIWYDPDGDSDPCDCSGNEYYLYSTWESNTICVPRGSVGGGPPIGTGSGGGGNSPPPSYPCIVVADPNFTASPSLTGDPLPPCPPPSGGTGWIPTPPYNINNPCAVIDSLMKTAAYPLLLKKLRDSVTRNYEQGISYTNPLATPIVIPYTGTQDSLAVRIEPANPTDGIAHNHNNSPDRLSIYSIEDIYRLAYINSVGKVKDAKIFTYPLVTDSTSYIIMITDTAKFGIFSRTWFDSPKHINAFRTQMYENYSLGLPGLTNLENEKNFLQGINSYPAAGCGLKLFRGDANLNTFSPIKVTNLNGLIKIAPDPCN